MSNFVVPDAIASAFFYFTLNSARRAKRVMNGQFFTWDEPLYAGERNARGNCYLCGKKFPSGQLAVRTVLDTGSWTAGSLHFRLKMPVCEKCREAIDIPDWKLLKKGWAENLLPLAFLIIGGAIDACFLMGLTALAVGFASAVSGNPSFLAMYFNPQSAAGMYASAFIIIPALLRMLRAW